MNKQMTNTPTDADGPLARPSALAKGVYWRIRADIMALKLPPGAHVSVDSLARKLDVSQTPVREALTMLESNGLVVRRQFSGYQTAPRLTRARLDELFEFRLLVEPHAARKAALAMDAEKAAALQGLARRMDPRLGPQDESVHADFADTDTTFHQRIAQEAGNELIAGSLAKLHIHMQIFRSSSGRAMAVEAVAEHALVLDSILAHDGSGAERAMREHIERSWQRMRGLVTD